MHFYLFRRQNDAIFAEKRQYIARPMNYSLLRERRILLGLTQQDLADRMGITRQNISQSLNRNAKSMRYDSFSKMVTALGYEIVVKKL